LLLRAGYYIISTMIYIMLGLLGLCFGSFINALVWRLHTKKDWVRERSICTHCHHVLAPEDLIPVISWLWLRGKCRYCHKRIEDNPIAELTTPFLFIFSYIYWPFNFSAKGTTLFVFWLCFLVGLIALAIYDLKWYLLPDKIVYFLMGLALIQAVTVVASFHGGLESLWQLSLSFLIGGGIFYLLFQLSGGKWIGGGDVKLGLLLGLMLGDPQLALFSIFSASVLGTMVSLPLLALGKATRTSRIPFGPFLIMGAILARLFGQSLIAWYRHKLLLG
jgi:leader peptidase (prepilin peptidase)/N-methyltransferase